MDDEYKAKEIKEFSFDDNLGINSTGSRPSANSLDWHCWPNDDQNDHSSKDEINNSDDNPVAIIALPTSIM